MGPLPYPHRATFLASTLTVPPGHDALRPYIARLISVIVFDQLVRHPVVTLGDQDDERLTDDTSQLLDALHPQVEDSIDWLFRVSRRHEVLWFDISLDQARLRAPILRARKPTGLIDQWTCRPDIALSQQLEHCLVQWLAARRLPPPAALPSFTVDDVCSVAERLVAANDLMIQGRDLGIVPRSLTQPPQRLPVAFLRVLGELSRDDARTLDPVILRLDPTHPVARRNRYVTELVNGTIERHQILPLIAEAPMYAKPHLSVWGDTFAAERPLENMGVRHQGIAVSLMPANPYACHNYSLQLAEHDRREESFRWADRATVAAPQLGAAHLDCVRRVRQVGRPGHAFAEAQYRAREILDRASAGKLSANDWQAPHHAALLVAFVHLDVGRLAEAIDLADDVIAQLPDGPAARDAFAWATKRVAQWKTDAGLLARAYAREGHYRGDVGRALAGFLRGGISDGDDAMMLIDALCATGWADQAETAYWQCAGQIAAAGSSTGAANATGKASPGPGLLGDGKARLAAARALIITGDLDEAIDQIQIVELRRSQGRLEAEINRLLRLAAIRPAAEWERAITRRAERGAPTLARMAARDLCDFVPGLDGKAVRAVLGEPRALALDPLWISELIAAVPAAQTSSPAIVARLAMPASATLAAADALAQDWWTALVPSARDRDAHAAGAMLALGLALANYLSLAAGPATPLAGAYRHIATEALHLVRRSRFQIEPVAVVALLRLLDCLGDAPDWLLDPWVLRLERALDLEAEHGAYLEGMLAGMPRLARLMRGDERIGWELRLAHDLAGDPSQYEAAAAMFARSTRAVEGGAVWHAWSVAASVVGSLAAPIAAAPSAASAAARLDVHWTAALANPGVAGPWLLLAHSLLAVGRRADGFAAACQGVAATPDGERTRAVAELAPRWTAAGIATPLDGTAAFERGAAAAAAERLDAAVEHLRWAAALEPANPQRAHSLAVVLARLGRAGEALRALSRSERGEAPRTIGRVLADSGHHVAAVRVLRYATRRFRSVDDWAILARAAHRAGNDPVAVDAGRHAIELGANDPALWLAQAAALQRIGEFAECEQLAQRLVAETSDRQVRAAGLHAMARALAGLGRHVDAHRYARACAELGPTGDLAAELAATMELIIAQDRPAVRPGGRSSPERAAYDDLEAGRFDAVAGALGSPSWAITGAALAACEFRSDDDSGIPVSPRALDAAVAILARTVGATNPDAAQARIRALRIRDNAFIQLDPPPPLGTRYTVEQFERAYAERERRPNRPSQTANLSPRSA